MRLRNGDGPVYQSIMAEVKLRIAEGSLRPGERLPTTRELASSLGVDPNTVARAYGLLEREGVLEGRQGRGTFVASHPYSRLLAAAQDERLRSVMRRALLEAFSLGYGPEQVRAAFEAGLMAWRQPGDDLHHLSFQGSHDPALDVLWALASRLEPRLRVRGSNVGSLWGLVALGRGEAHLAGAHLFDPGSGEYNLPWIRRLLPGRRVALLRLGGREQGLMFRRADRRGFSTLADIAQPGVRFVNRQQGSGTRVLLDHHLQRLGIRPESVAGYEREETTHSGVASAVAGGTADVGLGLRSAARALDLAFTPVASEQYDLVTLAEALESEAVAPVATALRSREFRELLGSSGGYDTAHTGDVRIVET